MNPILEFKKSHSAMQGGKKESPLSGNPKPSSPAQEQEWHSAAWSKPARQMNWKWTMVDTIEPKKLHNIKLYHNIV